MAASLKQHAVKITVGFSLLLALILLGGYLFLRQTQLGSCIAYAIGGFRQVAQERSARFLGKVHEDSARCRGGEQAVAWRGTPWIDWQRYGAASGAESLISGLSGNLGFVGLNSRGINGALLDLEYQRVELLKFNLFDNSGSFEKYVRDRSSPSGHFATTWPELRLPRGHPLYAKVGGDGLQRCSGELIRFRTVSGICNDIVNPLMGSTGQPFARNVDFESTFAELAIDPLAINRHGDRLGLLTPDPQLISRKLFSRTEPVTGKCNGHELPTSSATSCDYQKASHLNLLAAFWIQFMTHDWFSHLQEGHNQSIMMAMGCENHREANKETERLGCRPQDRIDKSLIAEDVPAPTFHLGKDSYMARAPRTTANKVTAWWDASQVYGYDETSRRRVKRDSRDPAKLLLEPGDSRRQEAAGYLPRLNSADPMNPQWIGQEAVAFPDNWNIGLSFFHNVFAREHNLFVNAFRRETENNPHADSGLRRPDQPDRTIPNKDVSADELFEVARLVVAAEIAKIHTIEWTPQLLYNEPVYLAMNANWSGLFENHRLVGAALQQVIRWLGRSESSNKFTGWYAAFAAGPGIVGLGNRYADVNAGVNHFGSPFNFPEEFVNAYRLHPMLPDFIEYREMNNDANVIRSRIALSEILRGKATLAMRQQGPANWALTLGRQRLGKLTLQNHPAFLQSLSMPRLKTGSGKIDVAALDLIRDRERGIPRYNEYRRQYGLKQLTKFEDFIDPRQAKTSAGWAEQKRLSELLREIYGQHRCDSSKIITRAQKNDDGSEINDCLGHPNGSLIDNIEDLDAMVGWLAEFARPHGFAISETQFQVFILNASRRLFSDRFLTSSFRPAFYTNLGYKWVNENGPDGKIIEHQRSNGHIVEVSPLKRVLQRNVPELREELENVVNVFDPWARDRGEYYSLEWKPRPGAQLDQAFRGH
jgi:hypothetical protein